MRNCQELPKPGSKAFPRLTKAGQRSPLRVNPEPLVMDDSTEVRRSLGAKGSPDLQAEESKVESKG